MKKIMFNDRYGLTAAVLEGRKTMMRQIATYEKIKDFLSGWLTEPDEAGTFVLCDRYRIVAKSTYKIDEVVAVAQSYNDVLEHFSDEQWRLDYMRRVENAYEKLWDDVRGINNKMLVKSELMLFQIQITDIKVERLQDISEEDCLREGIQAFDTPDGKVFVAGGVYVGQDSRLKIAKGMINLAKPFKTPQEAFAVLIDKVSGKGTWASNPWVFAYTFELIK